MPLSSACIKLVSECMSHMKEAELLACMQVCRSWSKEAKLFIFETVDLRKGQRKLTELQDHPHRICYIWRIIGDPYHFTHIDVTPTNVRTLEFHGGSSKAPHMFSEYTNELISAFHLILQDFIFCNSVPMTYPSFCTILKTLIQCKQLRKLSLPLVHRSDGGLHQKHADDADEAFHQLALQLPNVEDRPQPQFLQLVPASERQSPQLSTTACTKGPRESEYKWLEECNYPFDLSALRVLVVGSPAAAQIILPIASNSLCRLELCQAFDPHSSWTQYEELQAAPIQLPSLNHLVLTFLLYPSKWLLDVIRAPGIETITFKWATSMSHSLYEEQFRHIDSQIARLDGANVFPSCLTYIVFVTDCCSPPSGQWVSNVFLISSQFGVMFSQRSITFYDGN
ncbi:hypothetical protein F5876DRAFT_76998 [Lentinula aff. lateritia]|uniref:Uncharacterized protein n=1 Tax=Lentinula aff. lateritia TaxID=2804960 RepID=A0ACC1U0U8_9AGAR|nr:hypothetical protein F5876DRAFT_76998 [Lentinula aff. lateritia]